jgi:phospholipase/carboxylesterase
VHLAAYCAVEPNGVYRAVELHYLTLLSLADGFLDTFLTMTNLLPRIEHETAANPGAAVIWLHGLGADGNDFAGLVPELDLRGCGPVRFIFPHAPKMPVTVNGGYVMPAWYDIASPNLLQQQDEAGIERSRCAIAALVDNEIARGIASERIVLAGFSQGCAMALHTALRWPTRLAGIVALSGYLPLADQVAAQRHPANAQTPIFMAHGTQDPVVALPRAQESCNVLTGLGYAVQWHTYPMPHSVHPQEISDISAFFQSVLAA